MLFWAHGTRVGDDGSCNRTCNAELTVKDRKFPTHYKLQKDLKRVPVHKILASQTPNPKPQTLHSKLKPPRVKKAFKKKT